MRKMKDIPQSIRLALVDSYESLPDGVHRGEWLRKQEVDATSFYNFRSTLRADNKIRTTLKVAEWMMSLRPDQIQHAIDLHSAEINPQSEPDDATHLRALMIDRKGLSSREIRDAIRKYCICIKAHCK